MQFKDYQKALKNKNNVTVLSMEWKEEKLPEGIFEFPHLKELHLKATSLNDEKTIKLFSLSGLKNLKIFECPHLFKNGDIERSSDLEFLTIKNCGLNHLPRSLHHFKNLKEMNLSGNELTDLPEQFHSLLQLKRLNLDSNKFTLYPKVLTRMTHLKHLSLDQNLFSDEEKARIQREYHLTIQ